MNCPHPVFLIFFEVALFLNWALQLHSAHIFPQHLYV